MGELGYIEIFHGNRGFDQPNDTLVVSNMFHRSVDEPLWRVYSFCFTKKRSNQQLWGTQPTTMEWNGM